MAMTRYTDEPGSPAWHARRTRCFNAGDASAAMGCHPSGKTRSQLLHALHTGIELEFSDYVQERVINPGHRVEALWRPIAEEIIGDDLQVFSGTLDVPGLSRPLGASLDAGTFMQDTLGECKSANEALREALPHTGRDSHEENDARRLPKGYRVQMEQQQLVTGATRTLFSAMGFDAEGNPTEERHCWYESDPALRAEILAAWKQVDADLATYTPPAASSVEKIVAEPVEALPAPVVTVAGQLTLTDNFKAFEKRLRAFLDTELVREPKTDEDFAKLDVQIKAMKGAEAALDSAEAQMLAQIQTVDQAKKTKDMLAELVRKNRLMAEKLLASEKERRRGEIVAGGIGALKAHVDALNKRLGKPYMPATASAADFGTAIKGLKSLASMEDRVATELARAKIAANETADRISTNLAALGEWLEFAHLFPDTAAIVLKAPDDCRALIDSRIAAHRAQEERRLEAERTRIRAEEEARAAAKVRQEQEEAARAEEQRKAAHDRANDEGARLVAEAMALQTQAPAPRVFPADLTDEHYSRAVQIVRENNRASISLVQRHMQIGYNAAATLLERMEKEGVVSRENASGMREVIGSAATVHQLPPRQSAPATPPSLRLGEINARLAPLKIDAAGLAALGFPHAKQEGAAKLWHERDFAGICDQLIANIARAKLQPRAA